MKHDQRADTPSPEALKRSEAALVEALAERVYRQLQRDLRLETALGGRTGGPTAPGGSR